VTTLSPREQRLIAVLVLLMLIAAAWQFVVGPLLDGFARRSADREQLTATIDRNARLIASVPQLRRRIELQRPDRARIMLGAANRDLAGDLLRQRLQQSFEATGASVSAVGESDAGGTWVGASIEGTVSLDQLTQVLEQLQNQPPYLVVTGLTVVADRAFQTGKLDLMNVKIDVAIPYSHTA
jgi:type II secretory pathway component PulM